MKMALNNKGNALDRLGRSEEALEAYDAGLEVRPDLAELLHNKIVTLLQQERKEEAIEHLCRAWRTRDYLSDKGASLARIFTYLGKAPEECQ